MSLTELMIIVVIGMLIGMSLLHLLAVWLLLLMTGTPDALNQLSGEIHGSVQAVIVDDSRYVRQAVLGRLRQAPYAGGSGAIAVLGSGGPTLAYGESATDAALAYANKKPSFPIKAPPLAAPVETLFLYSGCIGRWRCSGLFRSWPCAWVRSD